MKDEVTKHMQLTGNYAPVKMEMDAFDIPVTEGKLPEGLNGVLYRNGTNPMYAPLNEEDHHWFLSEGMIHAVFVKDGRVSYRNRWTRTEQFEAQKKAGKRLVTTGMKTPSLPEAGNIAPHFAATHALYHADKLLALDEWNGPAALDGDTLETLFARYDFGGETRGAMTAHPKVDPDTGQLIAFGYQADGLGTKTMSYTVVDRSGKVERHDRFDVPYCSVAHDFAVTEKHVVFPLFSADISMERVQSGGPLVAYDPSLPSYFGIMERDADVKTIRWFKGDPCYAFHTMNAYTEMRDGREIVVVDMLKLQKLPSFHDLQTDSVPAWIRDGEGHLVRWTFDLSSNREDFDEELLCELEGEFPTIDNRYAGKKYTHGYYAAFQGEWVDGKNHDTIVHINTDTKERREYHVADGEYFMEPIFVPRTPDAAEGDGYIVTLSYSEKKDLSDFLVFDTDDITKGPICRVELPTRVPFGFHGSWRSFE